MIILPSDSKTCKEKGKSHLSSFKDQLPPETMRQCPTLCEWFRGCPNSALIYYAFSDRWLCEYCIGYARVGVARCVHDCANRGICVDPDTQSWFCASHAQQCEATIMRPHGCHSRGSHRCPRVAIRRGYDGRRRCAKHDSLHSTSPRSWTSVNPGVGQSANSSVSYFSTSRLRNIQNAGTVGQDASTTRPSGSPLSTPDPARWLQHFRDAWVLLSRVAMIQFFSCTLAVFYSLSLSTIAIMAMHALKVARTFNTDSVSSSSSTTLSLASSDATDSGAGISDAEGVNRFTTEIYTECCICLEVYRTMRRLKSCGHIFCETCLVKQIRSLGPWRDSCALCRSNVYYHLDAET